GARARDRDQALGERPGRARVEAVGAPERRHEWLAARPVAGGGGRPAVPGPVVLVNPLPEQPLVEPRAGVMLVLHAVAGRAAARQLVALAREAHHHDRL